MALCCVGVDSCIYSCYNTILFCYYTCTAMLQHLSGHQTEGESQEDDEKIAEDDGD